MVVQTSVKSQTYSTIRYLAPVQTVNNPISLTLNSLTLTDRKTTDLLLDKKVNNGPLPTEGSLLEQGFAF